MTIRLSGIGIHPVKSTAIRPVTTAEVMPWGLLGDRRWMVVDADGDLVSARELHELFTITAETPATEPGLEVSLRLRADGMEPLDVAEPDSDPVPVRLHSHDLLGRPAGPAADDWLRTALRRADLRLVWCDDPARRALNPAYSRPGDHTGFADGYPITLASLGSLARLNDWIAEGALARGETPPPALPIARFRPNLVIEGSEAFVEDDWDVVRIGEVVLRKAKPVDRCVMTTISTDDLSSGKEPIRTLARHRLVDRKTMFAIHLVPETTGRISVGDTVSAEPRR